jgi:hypothetical protein
MHFLSSFFIFYFLFFDTNEPEFIAVSSILSGRAVIGDEDDCGTNNLALGPSQAHWQLHIHKITTNTGAHQS